MKRPLLEALAICLAALALGLISNVLRPGGLPLIPASVDAPAAGQAQDASAITIDTAIAKFKDGSALFADARAAADYAAGHIAGAVNLPAQLPETWMARVLAEVEPERTVITYCAGSQCELSKELARILEEAGFENVFHLRDGWGQWTQRGLPVGKGAAVE